VEFLAQLHDSGAYSFNGVRLRNGRDYSYNTWRDRIKANFENAFYVTESHERMHGYYKDTVGSELMKNDFQLRPNQCIALSVAPALFDKEHAIGALEIIRRELMPGLGTGQLGIRTLNDSDPCYRSFYDNENDTNDFNIAHGFSYHNGPEWLWPVGYFLKAALFFTNDVGDLMKSLNSLLKEFEKSPWMSLPELTNQFGAECPFSCRAQAWSVGPIIEVLHKYKIN
jgi:glycogen debranching enzyme